jgi:hypothetical protein
LTKLKGKIQPSWSALTKVVIARLSYNKIGGVNQSSLLPVYGMKSLVEIDLSHNVLEMEREGCNSFDQSLAECTGSVHFWLATWLTSNVKLIDVSHNNMRQPGQNGKAPPLVQALASFAPKYPNLASFKASHNKFHGAFEFEQISQNIDFSHNDISSFSAMNWGVTQTGE